MENPDLHANWLMLTFWSQCLFGAFCAAFKHFEASFRSFTCLLGANFSEEKIVLVLVFTLLGCHQGADGSHRVNRNQNCDKNEGNVEVLWSETNWWQNGSWVDEFIKHFKHPLLKRTMHCLVWFPNPLAAGSDIFQVSWGPCLCIVLYSTFSLMCLIEA